MDEGVFRIPRSFLDERSIEGLLDTIAGYRTMMEKGETYPDLDELEQELKAELWRRNEELKEDMRRH